MMHPINDQIKVEVSVDEYGFGDPADAQKGQETGIAVEMPDKLNYFGYHSFCFENSFLDKEKLTKIYDYYAKLIGKRVYWKSYAERGMVLKDGDKTHAFIKMTDLIAFSDKDTEAYNVDIENGGAFKL